MRISMFTTMRIWRLIWMNKEEAVKDMIVFIEEKERELQSNKMTADQARSDVVKAILDELDRVTSDEN